MIKINLANTFTKKAGGDSSSSGTSSDPKQMALKIASLILPLIGLYIYEKHDLGKQREELAVIQAQSDKMDADLAKVGSIDNIIKQVTEQKKELEEKFTVIRTIFSLRTKKLQALVYMQQQIPSSSWLTKIKVKNADIEVEGFSHSIDDAQIFINKLAQEKSVFASVSSNDVVKVKVSDKEVYKFDLIIKLKE